MQKSISGIILAGGSGKRFGGQQKPRIELDGQTLLYIISGVLRNIFDEIIIVTNRPEEYDDFRHLIITQDTFKGKGPLAGIHAGLTACSNEVAFIVASDMPLINGDFISAQVNYFRENQFDIVVPRSGNLIEPLHSVYKISLIAKLEENLLNIGPHAVREFFREVNVGYFDVKDHERPDEMFMNINVQSDLLLVKKILDDRKQK